MKRLRFRPTAEFITDLKRLSVIDRTIIADVMTDINLLCETHELPEEFSDHALTGRYEGYRDFHVRDTVKGKSPNEINDVVVIYRIVAEQLLVIGANVGSHSHLFGGQNRAVKYHKK